MSLIYTTLCDFGKPTVADSYYVWGTEINNTLDKIDLAMISNNFAENVTGHAGLNFAYKNGRVANGTTITEVAGSTIALTDDTTNYVEVASDGTVSKNTTGFTLGKIPLFTVVTASSVITTVTDKRTYFSVPANQLFSSDGTTVSTTQNFSVDGTFTTDSDGNILVNGASAETFAEGTISLKQSSSNPLTNSADQVTLFATAGGDSTIGLMNEAGITNSLLPARINTSNYYFHARNSSLNPITSFISTTVEVGNTTDETQVLLMTLPGKGSPAGQLIRIKLIGVLYSANASHQNTLKFYRGSESSSIYSELAVLSNETTFLEYIICIKDDQHYSYGMKGNFGNYTWSGKDDSSGVVDFTNDVVIKITSTWTHADAGSYAHFYAGFFEILS